MRAINDKSKTIRIPANTLDLVNKTIRYCRKRVTEMGTEPTTKIARALGYSVNKVQMALEYSLDPICSTWRSAPTAPPPSANT